MKEAIFLWLLLFSMIYGELHKWESQLAKRQEDLKLLQHHLYLLEKEYDLLKHECQHLADRPPTPPTDHDQIWLLLPLLKASILTMYDFMLKEHGTRFKEYQDPVGVPLRLLAKNLEAQNCTLVIKYGLYNEMTYKKFI